MLQKKRFILVDVTRMLDSHGCSVTSLECLTSDAQICQQSLEVFCKIVRFQDTLRKTNQLATNFSALSNLSKKVKVIRKLISFQNIERTNSIYQRPYKVRYYSNFSNLQTLGLFKEKFAYYNLYNFFNYKTFFSRQEMVVGFEDHQYSRRVPDHHHFII